MILFQGDMPLDIDRAWEISPYNGAAFGALVIVLAYGAYYFMKQAEKKQEYIDTIIGKVHELSDTMADKLEDISANSHNNHSQNERIMSQNDKVIYILEDVKRRLDKIENNNE